MTSTAKASALAAAALLTLLCLSGCKTIHTLNSKYDTTFGKKQTVTNVHSQGKRMPEHLRRVALLPVFKGAYEHLDMASLEANLNRELAKRRAFELVVIEPSDMVELFSRERLSSVEVLPTKLLSELHEVYAIDGVLLTDVTYYDAYQPVSLGLRCKLLDGHTGEIAWSVDELFDGASPATSNAARKYFQTESVKGFPMQDTRSALQSMALFSKYVANALYDTLPLPN